LIKDVRNNSQALAAGIQSVLNRLDESQSLTLFDDPNSSLMQIDE